MAKKKSGKLIIIGGREDREKEMEILKVVATHVGDGRLCIVSVASTVGDELWIEYSRIFKHLGVKKLSHLDVVNRTESVDQKALKAVKDADAVFFTGGDQLKITSELGGTLVADRIMEIFENGGVVAGTSAGAAIMGEMMLCSGEATISFRIGSSLNMAAGMGFAKKLLIDQHFAERGRIGRLLAAVAHNPRYLGVGIDEDTAIVMDENMCIRVIGSGAVYIIDAHESSGLNISEAPKDTTLSMFNTRLHILSREDRFDIDKRVALKGATLDEGTRIGA
jgi:cyanophycinase